jgi:hypothetical protein
MIDPQLQDWWSDKRLTEIRYKDLMVQGAGIPLRVILPIFSDLDLVWFSRIYGEFDDNIILLGCDTNAAAALEKVKHGSKTPVQSVYDGAFHNEYALTENVCSALGMRFDGNSYSIERENEIAYQVYIHDNCFFFIKPATESVLRGLIENVLEQHSFYLREDVDWSGIADNLERQLIRLGKIALQSDPRRHCMWIPQLEPKRLLWKVFGRGTVLIENGKARFRVIHG